MAKSFHVCKYKKKNIISTSTDKQTQIMFFFLSIVSTIVMLKIKHNKESWLNRKMND